MRVIFTRHGETKENAAGLSMGQGLNGSLNEVGLKQAERLAHRLKDQSFRYIYTSDLSRAVMTAETVARFHPAATVIKTPELRERHFGIFEGKPRAEWKKALAAATVPWHDFKAPQGDSYAELQSRVVTFWNQLLQQHPQDTLLVVSHGAVLGTLFLHLFNRPLTEEEYEHHKPDNAAVTLCEFSAEGTCTTHILNSTEHLVVEQITQA